MASEGSSRHFPAWEAAIRSSNSPIFHQATPGQGKVDSLGLLANTVI